MPVLTCVLGALLLCTCVSAQTRLGISRVDWGTTVRGEKVAIYTLAGAGGLEARISDFGGVIVTLNVPNRNGSRTDVMLGYDDLASYEKGGVYGAVIGRYANRIGSNGTFLLGGKTIQLERRGQTSREYGLGLVICKLRQRGRRSYLMTPTRLRACAVAAALSLSMAAFAQTTGQQPAQPQPLRSLSMRV